LAWRPRTGLLSHIVPDGQEVISIGQVSTSTWSALEMVLTGELDPGQLERAAHHRSDITTVGIGPRRRSRLIMRHHRHRRAPTIFTPPIAGTS